MKRYRFDVLLCAMADIPVAAIPALLHNIMFQFCSLRNSVISGNKSQYI
jgi:hypothetical protein